MKIFLRDLNAKVGTDDIFKPTAGNKGLHEISNDNGVRVVKFSTSKNLSGLQCSLFATFTNKLELLWMENTQSD
jgi:hypothetical protein